MYTAPQGTLDILPEDQPYWLYLRDQIRQVATLFDYQPIDIPIFEDTSLYVRGVGEGTDIVDKEMYSFTDKGGDELTLRPEFTAGVVRAYLQHGMKTWPQPVKLWTIGPIFRYETAAGGALSPAYPVRYRVHRRARPGRRSRCDVGGLAACSAISGFQDLAFQLNSTGCPKCRPAYLQVLVEYYRRHEEQDLPGLQAALGAQSSAPARLQGGGLPADHRLARRTSRTICATSVASISPRCAGISMSWGAPYTINHRLVRGLDYYTKTVFEVWAKGIGAQNAICGGGRYDGLAEELGGEHTPGIGFGSGMERLVLAMKEQGIQVPGLPAPQVALIYRGPEAKMRAVESAHRTARRGPACHPRLWRPQPEGSVAQRRPFGCALCRYPGR